MAAKKKTAKKAAKKVAKKAAKKVAKKITKKPTAKKVEKKAAAKKAVKKSTAKTTAKATEASAPAAKKTEAPVVKAKPATLSGAEPVKKKEKKKKKRVTKAQQAAMEEQEVLNKKWENLYTKAGQIKSAPYNMRSSYEAQTGLEHKVLGWGFILSNKNDRLEVLFESGIKVLISNYK